MTAPDALLRAATEYVRQGYSVIPCIGKQASIRSWKALMHRRPTHTELWNWYRFDLLQNIAVVCGAVSGNLVVIDLDEDSAIAKFTSCFPQLTHTWAVKSGSGRGLHLYIRVREVPPTTRTVNLEWGNVELRSTGAYVIAPPSVHPDSGYLYTVYTRQPMLTVDNLSDLCAWIKHENDSKRQTAVQTAQPQTKPAIGKDRAARWAQAALAAECANVRAASRGSRNHTLNRAAFKMGQLVGEARLQRADVETALQIAAAGLITEDGEGTVIRTIRSGIEAGLEQPRSRS